MTLYFVILMRAFNILVASITKVLSIVMMPFKMKFAFEMRMEYFLTG